MSFGIFNDEGCVEGNFCDRAEAEEAIRTRYAAENPADLAIHETCHEHDDEQRDHCPHCDWQDGPEDA